MCLGGAKVGDGAAEDCESRGGLFAQLTSRGIAGRSLAPASRYLFGWLPSVNWREEWFVGRATASSKVAARFTGGGCEPVLEWEQEEVLLHDSRLDRDRDLDFLGGVEPAADKSPCDDNDGAE
ncbi:hypothetical protein MRX96_056037 [Rhipicephalus microplus]